MNLIRRERPANLEDKDLWLFENDLIYKYKREEICILNSSILLSNGYVFTKFGKIIKNSLLDHPKTIKPNINFLLRALIHNKWIRLKSQEKHIIAFTYWSINYFHWMTDTIPRLWLIKESIKDCTLLLPENFNAAYINESLQYFKPKSIIYLSEKNIYFSKQTLIPPFTSITGHFDPFIINQIRTDFTSKNNIALPPDIKSTKLYVTREKADKRKISNENELKELLNIYGFETIAFEDYNLSEQIRIMIHAKCLISMHGAGLTNMLFMKEKSKVLEIRKEGENELNCYFNLASALNITYYYQQSKPDGENDYTHTANLIVDIEKMKKNLELMLK